MPRKTRLDNDRRRRVPRDEVSLCEMDDIAVANPRFLSEKTEQTVAAGIFEVIANPDKYKHIQEKEP